MVNQVGKSFFMKEDILKTIYFFEIRLNFYPFSLLITSTRLLPGAFRLNEFACKDELADKIFSQIEWLIRQVNK
jgi:hypothetical protein